ncbi:HAD-IA family hydrolase [Candidatus Roizmanbacteria bacterium]|nr:HAD-IA family hydrolase [Candidatus Roizmanbacteria bacterium]
MAAPEGKTFGAYENITSPEQKQYLQAISTIDGREYPFTHELRDYVGYEAIHWYRGLVETEFLVALCENQFPGAPKLSKDEKREIYSCVTPHTFDPKTVDDIEHYGRNGVGPTEHDVKAVELHLRELFDKKGIGNLKEWIHFSLTSEDLNNIAWNLMIRDALNNVWMPHMLSVTDQLANLSVTYADTPVVGRTHGMKASPTTFGKRFSYPLARLTQEMEFISGLNLSAKLSGPVGNHNAMKEVAPDFDFPDFAKQFVESMGFEYEENATQRSNHINIVHLFNELGITNSILMDLSNNVRLGVRDGNLRIIKNPSHTGSSVMPHKTNPWLFEVGEGYGEITEAMISSLQKGLLESNDERDLTDHPYERSYGEIIARLMITLNYTEEGLSMLEVDKQHAQKELEESWEVLSEVIQMIARQQNIENSYMKIKAAVRPEEAVTQQLIQEIIEQTFPDNADIRNRLLALSPETYLGYAPQIARETAIKYREAKKQLEKGILDPAKRIDGVVFDFDNTLQMGDKEELHARLTAISENLDLHFSAEELRTIGMGTSSFTEMKTLLVKNYNARNPHNPITIEELTNANKQVTGTFDHYFYLADGAKELLDELKVTGKKIAIVTTRGPSVLRILEKYGITEHIDVIIHSESQEGLNRKPHPEPIVLALEKMRISPERTLMVGDKQTEDVRGAKAAGINKVALISPEKPNRYDAQPDHHFTSLSPLITLYCR